MSLLDSFIATFAPHACVGCGAEGKLLCAACRSALRAVPARCYRCRKLSADHRTCKSCRSSSELFAVRPATVYTDAAKELVWRLKFHGAQAAATEMASLMPLPFFSEDAVLVHVPTATSRVRRRGYDQARLLTASLARQHRMPYASLLRRHGQHHQVGASRHQRLHQLAEAFRVTKPDLVQGRPIVLIDDVLTTGATLEAAARVLKAAGAKRVEALVFAQA